MKDKSLYLFDLDGVIIDSKKNMRVSWNFVNKRFGLNISFKRYFLFIGRDFSDILRKLKIKKKNFDQIEKTFKKESIKNFNKYKLYPKVKSVLNYLEKKKNKNWNSDIKRLFKDKKNFKKILTEV